MFLRKMEVALGRADVAMAHQALDRVDIHPALQHVGRKGMA
jgi:hypothetical protein